MFTGDYLSNCVLRVVRRIELKRITQQSDGLLSDSNNLLMAALASALARDYFP